MQVTAVHGSLHPVLTTPTWQRQHSPPRAISVPHLHPSRCSPVDAHSYFLMLSSPPLFAPSTQIDKFPSLHPPSRHQVAGVITIRGYSALEPPLEFALALDPTSRGENCWSHRSSSMCRSIAIRLIRPMPGTRLGDEKRCSSASMGWWVVMRRRRGGGIVGVVVVRTRCVT